MIDSTVTIVPVTRMNNPVSTSSVAGSSRDGAHQPPRTGLSLAHSAPGMMRMTAEPAVGEGARRRG